MWLFQKKTVLSSGRNMLEHLEQATCMIFASIKRRLNFLVQTNIPLVSMGVTAERWVYWDWKPPSSSLFQLVYVSSKFHSLLSSVSKCILSRQYYCNNFFQQDSFFSGYLHCMSFGHLDILSILSSGRGGNNKHQQNYTPLQWPPQISREIVLRNDLMDTQLCIYCMKRTSK